TTQYLEEADRLADEIVVVDHGRVIARGDARALKRQVGGDQLHVVCVRDEDVPVVAAVVSRITGCPPSVDRAERSIGAPTDGGAISAHGGGSYKEFLMGGIFAQTIVFGCFGVAMALSHDRTNGAIDRFHSLPIPRPAVLSGHAVANLIRSLLPIALMSITGLV